MDNIWKPLSEAPKDGTPLLVATDDGEVKFFAWKYNQWFGYECFTSLDESGDWSIPDDMVSSSQFVVMDPPVFD